MFKTGKTDNALFERTDPRTLFVLLLLAAVALFTLESWPQALFLLLILCVYACYEAWSVLIYVLAALCLYGLNYLLMHVWGASGVRIIGLFAAIALRMCPSAMLGSLIIQIPTGRVMALLYRWRVPPGLRVAIVTALRFMPDAKQQFRDVRAALKIRHLPLSLAHPLRSFEYLMVPVIHKSLKLAAEMSAAIITKGIEADCPKSSYHKMAFGKIDLLWLLSGSGIVVWGLLNKWGVC